MSRAKMALIALAVISVALSLLNASWLAPAPKGPLVLIAHRGVAQTPKAGPATDGCSARHIEAPKHNFIENTLFSMQNAVRLGARAIAIDVQLTADGHVVAFRDVRLECRTNGEGEVRSRPLAYLKGLDVGHGYTADGGRTFPLRGRGIGAMPTVEDVLQRFPGQRLILNVMGEDPATADAIAAAFARVGVRPGPDHGFHGAPAVLARIRERLPGAWTLSGEASGDCFDDYLSRGWMGFVPDSCRAATLAVPLEGRWMIWGWPYRFLARMAGAGTQVMITGRPLDQGFVGLEQVEQLGEVPRDFRGLLLIEDMYAVGRALQR